MSADETTVSPGTALPGGAGARHRPGPVYLLACALAISGWSVAAAEPLPTTAVAPAPGSDPGMDPTFAPVLGHWPPSTVLERVTGADAAALRRVLSLPSIERSARLDATTRIVELDRFGRRIEAELGAALTPIGELILDLRHNHGGSVRRMLQVAARFTGPVPAALRLIADDGVILLAIPDPSGPVWHGRLTVLVGDDTISSGEVLAALLRRYAHAAVLGERTWGKDFAMRVVWLDQDWRALEPAGRLEVPGEVLHGGLLPDGPIPAALLARVDGHRAGAATARAPE